MAQISRAWQDDECDLIAVVQIPAMGKPPAKFAVRNTGWAIDSGSSETLTI
jgi:hypothetical protein